MVLTMSRDHTLRISMVAILLMMSSACRFGTKPADSFAHMQKVEPHKIEGFDAHFAGRWSILTVGYTHCPDVCPTMMGEFKQILQTIEIDPKAIQFVFLSIDPEHDTSESLAAYARYFSERIKPLRLESAELASLARQLGAGFGKTPDTGQWFHSTQYFVISPELEWVGYYRSSDVEHGELALDIKSLQSAKKPM